MKNDFNWEILKHFSGKDHECFSYDELTKVYPEKDKAYLSKVLSSMIKKGMLVKLKHGLYHIVPTNSDHENFIPDWHLVAKYLMQDKEYYIGYYSAMQIHNLITQPSLTEIIVTKEQWQKSKLNIQNVDFKFVKHTETRFFGFKNTWINDHDKVKVSDLEKTLVDALTWPHLCSGMIEVGKAIYESRDKISLDKLIDYLTRNGSKSAIKRYLFVYDLFGLDWTSYHESLLLKPNNSYSLLDTSGPDEGVCNYKFGLKINVDTDTIKNAIYS